MKYLKPYRSLNESINIGELEDIFIPLKDFNIEKFNIRQFTPNKVDISWIYNTDISFGGSTLNINNIKNARLDLDKSVEYKTELYDILERLVLMGYIVDYFESSSKNLVILIKF